MKCINWAREILQLAVTCYNKQTLAKYFLSHYLLQNMPHILEEVDQEFYSIKVFAESFNNSYCSHLGSSV